MVVSLWPLKCVGLLRILIAGTGRSPAESQKSPPAQRMTHSENIHTTVFVQPSY